MRSFLLNPLVLYPLLALAAGLAVVTSLRPSWPVAPVATAAAQREGPAYDFAAAALAAVQPGPAHVSHVGRDGQGAAISFRLARTMESVGQDSPGALLPFTAQDAAAFVGRPATVELRYRPLPFTTAEGISVRWAGDGAWQAATLQPGEGRLSFALPAPATAPAGLEIRIDSTKADYAYGAELVWVRLTPDPAAAGAP